MIVRIATEDQYEIPGDHYTEINDLDDAVVAAVEAGDQEQYEKRFAELIDWIRANGKPVGADELRESDVIVPPPDTTMAEAAADFTGEGLIPDSVVESA
jgi:hypothetical protein